jgi:hypothetical protein
MCRPNERTHKHHLIPRYKGGSDSPENLVEVTVTQHAMFHFCNYQLWGNDEDKLAWRALSGQLSMDEIKIERMALGGKKGNQIITEKLKDPKNLEEHKEKCREAFHNNPRKEEMIQRAKDNQPKAVEAARTPEAIEKMKRTRKERGVQQGENNSQYGTMWITDGTIEGSIRIKKGDPIPEGFVPGAVFNTENYVYKPGEEHPFYNMMWITNGDDEYMINKDEPIPDGYYKGRTKKFRENIDKDLASKKGKYLYENKLGMYKMTPEEHSAAGRKGGTASASQRWKCTKTGYVSNAGPLTVYQRNRGIDPSNRIRIK